jgi:hypothetical protein
MRAHVVENGIVVNTIEVSSLSSMPNLIDGSEGGIGDRVVDGKVVPKEPEAE